MRFDLLIFRNWSGSLTIWNLASFSMSCVSLHTPFMTVYRFECLSIFVKEEKRSAASEQHQKQITMKGWGSRGNSQLWVLLWEKIWHGQLNPEDSSPAFRLKFHLWINGSRWLTVCSGCFCDNSSPVNHWNPVLLGGATGGSVTSCVIHKAFSAGMRIVAVGFDWKWCFCYMYSFK